MQIMFLRETDLQRQKINEVFRFDNDSYPADLALVYPFTSSVDKVGTSEHQKGLCLFHHLLWYQRNHFNPQCYLLVISTSGTSHFCMLMYPLSWFVPIKEPLFYSPLPFLKNLAAYFWFFPHTIFCPHYI